MNLYYLAVIFVTVYVTMVYCHGNMLLPITWFDHKSWIWNSQGKVVYEFSGLKSGRQCFPGTQLSNKNLCPTLPNGCEYEGPGAACYWFTNGTNIVEPLIFERKLRTYGIDDMYSYYNNPWRAPGRARVDSPCGVVGGNKNGCLNGPCDPQKGGFGYGIEAQHFKFPHEIYVTNWHRGDIVEVAWGIRANHGGGYSYRLCRIPEKGVSALTEECFQKTNLEFFGNMQWAQYGENTSSRISFPAVRTKKHTFPKGSEWTKNPIPSCKGKQGGFFFPPHTCPKGTQFSPPKPNLFGYGTSVEDNIPYFRFSIIDKVKVPKTLNPGKYVLSFRWDCEQTAQVWNTCATVNLI